MKLFSDKYKPSAHIIKWSILLRVHFKEISKSPPNPHIKIHDIENLDFGPEDDKFFL